MPVHTTHFELLHRILLYTDYAGKKTRRIRRDAKSHQQSLCITMKSKSGIRLKTSAHHIAKS